MKLSRLMYSCAAALVGLVVLGTTASDQAFAQCTPIDGGKLSIKPVAGNTRSRFDWKAKDKSADFLIADPRVGTTTLELSAGGVVVTSLVYDQVSAAGWRGSGSPVRTWSYKSSDDPSPIDGIEKIKNKRHLFKLKGKQGVIDLLGAPLALPINMQITDSAGACYLARFRECTKNNYRRIKCKTQVLPELPNLVFQSGFEDATQHGYSTGTSGTCTDDLRGEDLSVERLGHWENDLEGGPLAPLGQFHFCFGGGDRAQRSLDLVPDPDDPTNQVLYGRITEPNENVSDDQIACNQDPLKSRKARIQAMVKRNFPPTRIDYRLRVRLGAPAFNAIVAEAQKVSWMTIAEFWNNQPTEAGTFRVTLNLIKEAVADGPLYFGLKSDKQNDGETDWIPVWPAGWPASAVEVPIGEWFTLEITIIEGDASTGRVHVRMTDAAGQTHTIADVTNWTYSPDGSPDGFQDTNPLKLYTSGYLMCALKDNGIPLEIWWDDFAIGTSE